ncbi:hypothetical protein WJX73_003702 [Symbiochloris irregularis]|uniref:Uncharacterized protein n=1 Tax=Symbiochloris irregularis TaxID=706552 RepID=A0AAW1PZE5_9CHLO
MRQLFCLLLLALSSHAQHAGTTVPMFYVYTHGSNATLAELQQSWFGNETFGEVHKLDNFGRESHPYFFHILRHYGHFPAFLLFHQALPEKGCSDLFINRIQRLRPNTGMLSLGDASVCTCSQCWGENPVQFKEIWAMARQEFCSPEEKYATFLKGAFVVASRRVMAVPHRTYSALYQYLEAPDGHWLHRERSSYGTDSHNTSSPTLGHIIERSWNALFDCLDPGVVHPDFCTVKCVPERDCSVEACPPTACQCLEAPGRFDWLASST